MEMSKIHPSQLYISEQKLKKVQESLNSTQTVQYEPIPIKILNGKTIFVDGHTRAVALHLIGHSIIQVYQEYEDLDWELYEICVQWCMDEKIYSIEDLSKRIIPHSQYEILWYQRCDELHAKIEKQRNKEKN